MAARKTKPEGRIRGSKNVKRSRLVAAAPGEITPMHIELAHPLAMAQLGDAQIATALGVSETTLNRWKTTQSLEDNVAGISRRDSLWQAPCGRAGRRVPL